MAAPAIGRRTRFTPTALAEIKWGHPLARRLVACHLPNGSGAVDLAFGINLPKSGAPNVGVTQWGKGMQSTSDNAGAFLTTGSGAHRLNIKAPISIMWAGSRDGAPAGAIQIYQMVNNTADTAPFVQYGFNYTATIGQVTLAYNNAGTYRSVGAYALPLGSHVFVGVIPFSPAFPTFYVNGTLVGTGAVAGPTTAAALTYTATSGMACFVQPPVPRTANSTANIGAIWNRVLTAGEIQMLSADPFCFLDW